MSVLDGPLDRTEVWNLRIFDLGQINLGLDENSDAKSDVLSVVFGDFRTFSSVVFDVSGVYLGVNDVSDANDVSDVVFDVFRTV